MFNTFINSFKVSFAEGANEFIYFLKRIPILGKIISDRLYKHTGAKLAIGVFSEMIGILKGFFKKSLYIGLMIVLPAYLLTRGTSKFLPAYIHIFFFLSFVTGPFMKTVVFDRYNKQAFSMIILMRANAREYYAGEILYRNISDFVYFLLPAIIAGIVIGLPPLKSAVIIFEMTAFRFIGEFMHLYAYEKKKIIIIEKSIPFIAAILICLGLAYGLPALGIIIDFQGVILNILTFIAVSVFGVIAFTYIYNYNKYTRIAKMLLTKNNLLDLENIESNMKFADVKLDEKEMVQEGLDNKNNSEKEGYEYLNSLFFLRHRRIMVNPIKRRVIFVGIIFLTSICVEIFMPDKRAAVIGEIQKSTPLLVFLMYLMSTGERITRAMFYNCDASLLRYAYYREAGVIISNFTSRLKRVVGLNLIPGAALCLAIFVLTLASGSFSSLTSMIPLFLCIVCLACFFSVHHLFMYYVIQPYTAELTVKSPLFRFINTMIYLISYGCFRIKTSSYYFTLWVMIITVMYVIIALIITYKAAPRTFRLK